LGGRDGRDETDRPDALADFPEEFEQRPGGPPRDLARRAKTDAAPPGSALARIEAMKRRVAELARNESDPTDD
jgi:hypothetical protein